MSDIQQQRSFLDELDERHDELLGDLDELSRNIELVLAEWTTKRSTEEEPQEKAA
ncbi:MAG: hypothetical protein IH991_00550 [Planctomycetes bacterium]|nr:hypothetical protein [Planctomycetota bacterium]